MIYVCEYDDTLPWTVIEKEARRFGLADEDRLPESVQKPQALRLAQRQARLRERVMARLLLEYALWREYGLHLLEELAWQTGGKGKPYSAAHPEIYFNMSHCETACACVTADHEVGIDVERRFAFRPALARRVCAEQERLLMERLPEAEQERLLQVLWSMKESYVKRDGRGLAYGLERIGLAVELEELRGLWSVKKSFSKCDGRGSMYSSQRIGSFEEVGKESFSKQGVQEPVSKTEELRQGCAGEFVVRVTPHYTLAVCGVQSDTAIIQVSEQECMRGERADDKTGI